MGVKLCEDLSDTGVPVQNLVLDLCVKSSELQELYAQNVTEPDYEAMKTKSIEFFGLLIMAKNLFDTVSLGPENKLTKT